MKVKDKRLRLPDKLVYTALPFAMAGALACSSSGVKTASDASSGDGPVNPTDAQGDTLPMLDAASDVCAAYYCASTGQIDGAVCPGPVCDLSECPADSGCEPLA